MTKQLLSLSAVFALLLIRIASAHAGGGQSIELTIKNHMFLPDRIEVAAGQAFTLLIKNDDDTPEEFDSDDLQREKMINGHGIAKIRISALVPGEYTFGGEFHEDDAKGVIVVK